MKISASIVTYNNEKEIDGVLNSLLSSEITDLKIVVVDNASDDNTCAIVKQYDKVELKKLPSNIGFGAGHNKALNMIDSDYHIIVNPDITLKNGMIAKMIDFLETESEIVLLTPKVLNPDKSEQFLPKKYPKFKYLIGSKFEKYSKLFYKWRSEYTLRDRNVDTPIDIDFCTGCFMVCRTSALNSVGGFDERYFLHFEDADLTREMQKFGRTVYYPKAYVNHIWMRENSKNWRIFLIALQSMFKYFVKWRKKNEK